MPLFGFDPSVIPDINFAQKDASIVQSQVISDYERYFYLMTRINKTLGRADPVRLFLLNIVYQLTVQRAIIDFTGKQNLIKYARGSYLDNIAARWGPVRGRRLQAQPSRTTLQFTLATTLSIQVIIPYHTQAQSISGILFRTDEEVIIPSGQLSVEVAATAVEDGELPNGLLPGQITDLVSWNQPYLIRVTNTIETAGGANVEDDEHFRARVWMAPESFSVAGPYGAYEYWAASANPEIVDVSVWSSPEEAGNVYIHPLMRNGTLPSQQVLDEVYAVCNADDIRPLTDHVFVQAPETHSYKIEATFWINETKAVFAEEIRQAVYKAFEEYKIWQRAEIGRDINPSKMIQMLMDAGASRVGLIEPGLDDPNNKLTSRQVAIPSEDSHLDYGGIEGKELAEPPVTPG